MPSKYQFMDTFKIFTHHPILHLKFICIQILYILQYITHRWHYIENEEFCLAKKKILSKKVESIFFDFLNDFWIVSPLHVGSKKFQIRVIFIAGWGCLRKQRAKSVQIQQKIYANKPIGEQCHTLSTGGYIMN